MQPSNLKWFILQSLPATEVQEDSLELKDGGKKEQLKDQRRGGWRGAGRKAPAQFLIQMKELMAWVVSSRAENLRVSWSDIQRKALELHHSASNDFIASYNRVTWLGTIWLPPSKKRTRTN